MKRVCKDIYMNKAYPHNFRHIFTVYMLKNTKDVYLVSKLLGHCNISIIGEYLSGLNKLDILEMAKGHSILENL